uniref:P53-induced death domain protein 1 n=1 Tax=Pavo cristatus TaxID=9049 RepID=A0A8C9F6R0_PAVCR
PQQLGGTSRELWLTEQADLLLSNLKSLRRLHLHSNLLVTVPASLASLPNLSRLDLQNNCLRAVPPEIQTAPFVHLRGNPLGETEPSLQAELRRLFLASEEDSFTVTSEGCEVVLACGIRFYFPPEAASDPLRIYFRTVAPDPQWVKLRHHDVLLSRVLELQPHGVKFQQEVDIWMPYASPETLHQREVVVRTFSGQSWSDLRTQKHMARCSVLHFSWFLVVSRLVQNECKVPTEGTLLFSSVDPNIKVTFPPGVTEETRSVKLQVCLPKKRTDAGCKASPLLCLSQDSLVDFLRPVRIQLPLPLGVTGLNLDRSRLHLLCGDVEGQTWDDITSQVVLEFTHLYAVFEAGSILFLNSLSDRYWLWYTTKTYIGGIAKKVYERLRMYQVNFIALQRRKDPEQVLLQCLPKHKVWYGLHCLSPKLPGPPFVGCKGNNVPDGPGCCPKVMAEVCCYCSVAGAATPVWWLGKRQSTEDSMSGLLYHGASALGLDSGKASLGCQSGGSIFVTSLLFLFFREDLDKQILDMLFSWAQQNSEDPDCVSKLITAMKESGRQDIADEVGTIIELGRQKYRESIRRVGLEQEKVLVLSSPFPPVNNHQ